MSHSERLLAADFGVTLLNGICNQRLYIKKKLIKINGKRYESSKMDLVLR